MILEYLIQPVGLSPLIRWPLLSISRIVISWVPTNMSDLENTIWTNSITFFILKYFDIDEFILWMIIVSYKLWRKTAKINIRPKTICNPIFYRSQVKKRYFQMHPKNNIVFNLTPTKPDLKDKVLSPSVTLFTRQYKILFKMLFFTITMHVN